MRTLAQKVRLLAWWVALAVALPAPLGGPSAEDEGAPATPAARAEALARAKTSLARRAPRAGWHGSVPSVADASDVPSEGSDGWASALDQAPPASFVPGRPQARIVGPARVPVSPPIYPVGTPCRLRC